LKLGVANAHPLKGVWFVAWILLAFGCNSASVNESGSDDSALELAESCTGTDGACIFLEEFDCDAKDFFRGPWDFNGTTAFGECYGPPGLIPEVAGRACSSSDECDQGAHCEGGTCSAVHNYFCATQVSVPTTYGCNSGEFPACSDGVQTCLDEWFECLPDEPTMRLKWPDLGDTCEDIILTYEIVAEQYDEDAAAAFCSKRHKGCEQATDCSASQRPAGDHCGPTDPATDAANLNYDCFTGENPVPACPASDDPAWPEGLGASMDLAFIQRAEEIVGAVCEAAGCSDVALCRPSDGTMGYVDGGLGIQGSSGIKDDSFIGHARVCKTQGTDVCEPLTEAPCAAGPDTDDSRDALVPGGISHREVDIRCQCVEIS
jgi:hypothetical protein